MMIYYFILFFSIFLFLSLYKLENPLNFSMKLSILTLLLFFLFNLFSSSWFPFILTMLVLGGILVIFSILSSLMPNEKMSKEKKFFFFLSFMIWSLFFVFKMESSNIFKSIKSFVEEGFLFIMILGMMLFYFYGFILILSLKESPMRKFICFLKKNFVNFLYKKSYFFKA